MVKYYVVNNLNCWYWRYDYFLLFIFNLIVKFY